MEGRLGALLTENLRSLRVKSGLSMRQMAEHLGVHKGTISRWETDSDSYRFPEPGMLERLADYYQIQVAELFKPQGHLRRTLEIQPDLATALLIVNKHMPDLVLVRRKKKE